MNKCYIIQNFYMVSELDDLQKKFLHGIEATLFVEEIFTGYQARIDNQIYYSGIFYILFLQAKSVIGLGSLWIHPSFGR